MIKDGREQVFKIEGEKYHCGVAVCYRFIGGKWKSVILWNLRKGKLRFSEIKVQIPDMTEKMLSLQLKALQKDGIIVKTVFGTKAPFRVEYKLSEMGKSLIPVISLINDWGTSFGLEKGELLEV